ncbi:MAG: M3 family metallopeptidase [Candidatus Gracilibacteria bacterium]|nr:M3 family metallopeptidase [Candidatus Gracilibacteria bacterium]
MKIKEKIINKLQETGIPDLKFLFSQEVLDVALEVLEDLLKEEKARFDDLINDKYKGLDDKILKLASKSVISSEVEKSVEDINNKNGKNIEKNPPTPPLSRGLEQRPLLQSEGQLSNEITFELFEEFSLLDLFFSLLNHLQSVNSSEKIRTIIEEFEPKYVDFSNYVAYSKRYYDMLVFCRKNCKLDDEQKRILDLSIKAYEVRGINLDKEKQDKLKEISKSLSNLSLKFGNNILDSQKEFYYVFKNDTLIKDVPENDLQDAKAKAEKKGKKGYLFDSSPASYMAIMKYCIDPTIRKHFFEQKHKFASAGDYDNRKLILEILKLRKEKSNILGYKNYAELSLVFKMADKPKEIVKLIDKVAKKAKKKAEKEINTLKDFFKLVDIKNWDLAYYQRSYKEQKLKFEEKELKKYFEFDKVLNGLFTIVQKLYGLEMREIKLDSYSQDLKIYEVYKDDKLISYFIGDYFYNENKRSGAWCDNLRPKIVNSEQGKVNNKTVIPASSSIIDASSSVIPASSSVIPAKAGIYKKGQDNSNDSGTSPEGHHSEKTQLLLPIIVNVCAFAKQEKGKTLLNHIDVETMFHEFGHAIHEMLSKSKYSELSGFNVEWDFVELPSQLMENWSNEEESLKLFATHYQTGENIPKKMLKTMEKLKTYGVGNFTIRQNEFAMLDMHLHTKKIPINIQDLDNLVLNIVNNYSSIQKDESYKMYSSFSHIFDGGYGSGYYSYMWAEIIEAQVWEEFKKNGIFDKKTAKRFYETILGAGTTKKASELFHDFLGKEVSPKAFLKRKKF